MNRMPAGASLMKFPVPQPGSSTVAFGGNAEAGKRLVHGRDDDGRGVEGVEGGALGAVVLLGRKQRVQLLAEGLPAAPCSVPVTGSGKIDRATAPKPPKRASACRSSGGGRPLFLLDGFKRADGGDDVAGLGFLAAG